MIYLDNAATSYPKPRRVYSELSKAMKRCGGNSGRGSHSLARASADGIYDLRETAAEAFSCDPEEVVLTYNATHALNLAIKGLAGDGGHILYSDMEHNSVRRPVASLCRSRGCTCSVYPSWEGNAERVIASLKRLIRPDTAMIIATHASNVVNVRLPVREIAALCRERGIVCIIDASQSAGHLPLSFKDIGADAVCMPGHKGLMGPQGSGLLLLRRDIDVESLLEGGSGMDSLSDSMPQYLPERLEAGTLAAPLAAALNEGIKWVKSVTPYVIHENETYLSRLFTDRLLDMDGVQVYLPHLSGDGGIVLFNIDGIPAVRVGELLDREGICVRCGLHCSPLAHGTIGTGEGGAVRVSFGYFNDPTHVARLVNAVWTIKREYMVK